MLTGKGRMMTDQEYDLYDKQVKELLDVYDSLFMQDVSRYARHVSRWDVRKEQAGVLERMMDDVNRTIENFSDVTDGLKAIIRGKPEDYFENYQKEEAEA